MFGAVGFDAAGRWRPPPQDRRPSSSAIDIDDEGRRRRREDDVVIGVCRDVDVDVDDYDDDDLGGENTIGDGGTLVLSSIGGGTIDDDEFTTFTNIVYGVVSPRLAVAGGGGCDDDDDRHHHHHGGEEEEDPHHHHRPPPTRHRHHPQRGREGAAGAAAAPSVVAPSTSHSRDGTTTTGDGTSSFDSYYQMQRNGPYIAGTNMRQDEVIRNAESWNQRVDLDDVDDDLRRRHSSVVGDGYPRDAMDGVMGDFCGGKVECGHVAVGGGRGDGSSSSSVGNSTLSSLTHEAWLPRFDVRGRFLSYYVQAKSPPTTATTTAKTESSPRTLSSPRTGSSRAGDGRQPSVDTPVSEGVRSPATEFMGDVILGPGGGASPPRLWHSASRVHHVDDRIAPPPPTGGRIGGRIARPAPLRLADRMTTGGHVPPDDADAVAASSSRPPAEVILVKSAVKGLDICFADNGGTNSVSHQLTPSSFGGGGSDGDLSHLIVSELRRSHMPGIRRSYGNGDGKPRYRWDCRACGGGGRAVLCLLAALFLIGIVVGGVLGGRAAAGGGGGAGGPGPGYDVVMWGPGTQGACCVNGDVAKPEGMFGPGGLLAPGDEGGGGEGGEAPAPPAEAPPLAGSGIFDAAPNGGGGGGGDPEDADPIELAPLGSGAFDGIVGATTTAPPTRGPTGAEASPGGGEPPSPIIVAPPPAPKTRAPTFGPSKRPTATSRDPTAGDEPASTSPRAPTTSPWMTTSPPSTTNPTQESSSSNVPSAPRPAPTPAPDAASPSASPTARVTPTTTTMSPNPAGMPAAASPSTSPTTAPTTTSPTAGVTASPSSSPTTAPTTTSPTTESPVTDSPVTGSPTLSPYELPTTTVTLEPTEKLSESDFFGECPDEVKDGVDYQAGEMVSYRTSSMWKVYECLDGACVAEELPPEGPAGAWILLGLCAPTNDQLNGTDDDTPQPTSSPIKSDPSSPPPEVRNLPEDDLPDEEIVFD